MCGLFEKLCLCELVTGRAAVTLRGQIHLILVLSTSPSGKRGDGIALETQRGTQSAKTPKNTKNQACNKHGEDHFCAKLFEKLKK